MVDSLPALEALTLDLLDGGKLFMADPIEMLNLTPNIKILNLFDSMSDDADVVPSRHWSR